MVTHKCSCGEKGYEGIFSSVYWTCIKCGKLNKFKAPKVKEVNHAEHTSYGAIEAVPQRASG